MYKILGGDQKEYGPVTQDQIEQWIRDNRANGQTLVQREGGAWVPLGTLPEFAPALGASRPILSTPDPISEGPTGGAPIPGPAAPMYSTGGPGGPGAGSTGSPYFGAGDGGRENARQMVQGPATALLVTGILMIVLSIIGLIGNLFGSSFQPPVDQMPPEMRPIFEALSQMQGPVAIASSVIGIAVSALVAYAGQKLKVLQSFGMVVAAAILAMVPCTSPCCCIGLPVGIWVLVVLFKPEVKSAFS